jgi:hypothetical protein
MCWPVATETVILSVPSIIGINIDPCVSGSVAMISFEKKELVNVMGFPRSTYTLIPRPISAHKVAVLSLPILKVTVWCIVHTRDKLGVCEQVVNDLPGIAVPEFVLGVHPFRYRATIGTKPLVLSGIRSPWDVS